MEYLFKRERGAFKNSVDEEIQTRSREFSHHDFAPQRRPAPTDIVTLLDRLREGPVRMIDALIAELQHRREAILKENMRMQREMAAYTKLSQTTMDSTREISETLANLAKQDALAMSELTEAVSGQGDRKTASEEFAEKDASRLRKARTGVPMAPE